MYEIKFIHKDETTENTLYAPGSNIYCLLSAKLKLECGKAGELTLEVPDVNPAKADFVCLTDEILVYRDGEELWRGRAITREEDFYKTGTLTCEGVLAYLYDTYYPPFEFSGSPADFLAAVLDNHNAQVEERKRIYLGNVTVEDNNDYIARSSIEYNRTLTVLTDKLINDSLGGYFRVRIEDGVKYLDYLTSYDTTATQPVAFGENLLDLAQEIEYSDLATVILPLGAKLEDSDGNQTDEYLTIADVNGGSIYYADETAVAEYGWIVVCNIWEDVTEASNLLTKAKNYLAQVTSAVSSFEVNAVDLALISSDYAPINLGDMVLIQSEPHGVNQYVELTSLTIDLLDPSNDTLTFGADTATLTDSQRSSSRSVQAALESLSVRYTNLVATVITTDYLTANYITANDIAAKYVTTDTLTANYITASDIKAKYATIDLANVSVESVGTLFADVGLLTSMTVVDGYITGALNGVTINADVITAGTLSVDRLLLTGEGGIVYAINASSSGLSETELTGEQYQNYINGTCIVAQSITANQIAAGTITADKIDVTDLFAQDITATGTISGLTLKGGSININDKFIVDADGNADVSGKITASEGAIGDFTIANGALYSNSRSTLSSTDSGVYIGADGISLGSTFSVTSAGAITANAGVVGPLTITNSTNTDAYSGHLYSRSVMIQKYGISATVFDDSSDDDDATREMPADIEFGIRDPGTTYTNNVMYLAAKNPGDTWESSNRYLQFAVTAKGKLRCNGISIYPDVGLRDNETDKFSGVDSSHRTAYTDSSSHLVLNRVKFGNYAVSSNIEPDGEGTRSLGDSAYYWRRIYVGTVYRTSESNLSDRKLKQNIKPLDDNYTNFIMGLEPVSYDFINGDTHRKHLGFIAQPVRDVAYKTVGDLALFKAQVSGDDDATYEPGKYTDDEVTWGLSYDEFIAPMVKMLQDQQRRIERLEAALESTASTQQ